MTNHISLLRSSVALLFILSGLNSLSQDNKKTQFLNECSAYYSDDYSVSEKQNSDKKFFASDPEIKKFNNNGLEVVSLLRFTSKKVISKNTKLRFRIVVYQYTSNEEAQKKIKELEVVKQTQDESLFNKDWDYLVLCNNLILRLDAGCLYSEMSWDKLKAQFLKIKSSILSKGSKVYIECKCGGSCS